MARICLQFASKWKDDVNGGDANKGLVFAKQMALKLEVESILQKNSLNRTTPYLELVQQNKFSELVMALYEDESIILSCTSNEDKQWPNINKACLEIGTKGFKYNNLSIVTIFYHKHLEQKFHLF